MGLDTGALGPWICDRSSRSHSAMGTRMPIHRAACLSDLVRQRPLSTSRGETRRDTYRNRHPCTFGAEDRRLETSARLLTRKRTPPVHPADRQLHASHKRIQLLGITAREILASGRRAGLSDFQEVLKELP